MLSFLRLTMASAICLASLSSMAFDVVSTQTTTQTGNEHYLKVLRIPVSKSKQVKYVFFNCVDSENNSTSYECKPLGNPDGYLVNDLAFKLSSSGYSPKENISLGRSRSSLQFLMTNTVAITSAQSLLSFIVNGGPKLMTVTSSNPKQVFENQNEMRPLGVTADNAFIFMQYATSEDSEKLQNIDLLSEDILIKTTYKMPEVLGGLNYLLKKKY